MVKAWKIRKRLEKKRKKGTKFQNEEKEKNIWKGKKRKGSWTKIETSEKIRKWKMRMKIIKEIENEKEIIKKREEI